MATDQGTRVPWAAKSRAVKAMILKPAQHNRFLTYTKLTVSWQLQGTPMGS
jgi:hypothetical protein